MGHSPASRRAAALLAALGGLAAGACLDIEQSDGTAPFVNILAPANGATVRGTVTIRVEAADDREVTRVSVAIDNVALAEAFREPYDFPWTTTQAPNGNRSVTATAEDAAGNRRTVGILVTVNNVPD